MPPARLFAGSEAWAAAQQPPGLVLSMGNFDGVHRGHRHLLELLVRQARAAGVPAAVYTFDPPPRTVLAPGLDEPRITDWTTRARLLGELGVEIVVIERFTRAFAQHPPEWFVDEVLGRRLCPLELVVGYDFRFGRARAGNVDTLRARLHGTKVLQVEALEMEGEVVSSSRIRRLLREGEVETAARLLGRPHEVSGVVVPGDRRGRTLGFPTANVETDAGLLPPSGVYAVRVQVDGGPATDGVANLGQRPTFGGAGPFLVEAHLLDFRGDLYGRALRVHFVKRLRSEQRFADVAALQEQIRADVVAARAVLAQ